MTRGLGPKTIELPALETISGSMVLISLAQLESIELGALRTVKGFNGTSVMLDTLRELTSFHMASLEATPSDFSLHDIGTNTGAVLDLDLKALTSIGGNLKVVLIPGLSNLDGLSTLESVTGAVIVTDNAALPTCDATDLVERVNAGSSNVINNLADSCSP